MKAIAQEKIYKITFEATEEEWHNLLDSIEDYDGYGVIEDFEKIVKEIVGERKDDE